MKKVIYISKPVNKTAAIVTNQSSCTDNEDMTDEQLRQNLVARVKKIEEEIISLPRYDSRRKMLAWEKKGIEKEIHNIRPAARSPEISEYFVASASKYLTRSMFSMIMRNAVEMKSIADNERVIIKKA